MTLPQGQATIMVLLALRGEATHLALELTSASEASVKVQVSNLRARLRKADIPVQITTIYGYGYRLAAVDGTP